MARTVHINGSNTSLVDSGPVISTARSTVARYKTSGDVSTEVSASVVRADDYSFTSGAAILTEQSATNYTTSDNTGAIVGVVGSGGALPVDANSTVWDTVQIVALGDVDGLPYMDLRLDVTSPGGNIFPKYRFSGFASNNMPALPDTLATTNMDLSIVAGSVPGNVDFNYRVDWFDNAFGSLGNTKTSIAGDVPTIAVEPFTLSDSNASIAYAFSLLDFALGTGEAMDATFRIRGLNMFGGDHRYESFISASSSAGVTRAADDLKIASTSIPAECVVVQRFTTPHDLADIHSQALLSAGGTDVLTIDASGNLDLDDGTTTATIASPTLTANTVYDLVIIAKSGDGMTCGIVDTGTGTAQWATTVAYDGAFPVGDIELLNGFPVAALSIVVVEDELPEASVALTKTWVEGQSAAGWPGGDIIDGRFGLGIGIGL